MKGSSFTNVFFRTAILITGQFFLCSCDALLTLTYEVQNDTKNNIKLKVEHYPIRCGVYGNTTDTIIELKPKEWIRVGCVKDIGFPFETKQIYKKRPAVHNFKIIKGDSVIIVNSEDTQWKYKRKTSRFKISNSDIK